MRIPHLITLLAVVAAPAIAAAQDNRPANPLPTQVAASFLENASNGDLEAAAVLLAPTFEIDHVMGRRFVQPQTREGMLKAFQAAPKRRFEVLAQVADGPFVLQKVRPIAPDGTAGPSTMWMFEVKGDQIIGLWHFDASSTMAARTEAAGP